MPRRTSRVPAANCESPAIEDFSFWNLTIGQVIILVKMIRNIRDDKMLVQRVFGVSWTQICVIWSISDQTYRQTYRQTHMWHVDRHSGGNRYLYLLFGHPFNVLSSSSPIILLMMWYVNDPQKATHAVWHTIGILYRCPWKDWDKIIYRLLT